MKKTLPISAAALAAVMALAGCSTPGTSGGSSSMPGMDHSTMGSSAAPAAANHSGSDTMFVQGMIPHHAQAVEMSDIILKKQGIDARITALATKIKAAQAPEIEKMTGWLKAWNEPTQAPGGHSMTGMMSGEDLTQLDAAQGTEAAKLFLRQMIAHHEGAVEMANAEVRSGKNAEAIQLAKDIAASQTDEIQEMQELLAGL
ncbi:uncharacterized protein (DUF305 family) [Pseudarthrobacter oxydans]|uniref:DUF305 domain-containing protein n=1 Tax=Pseudarthrobacter oxydans TaxID=1671 RepID=UPI00277E1E0A|nr:DUF305 domain-containing protein [Pseudarthrobacter oxydans]MDP9980675.1 uncharacterized protein (DUF305 family) [Pseudarthrobacter oxydans]